jgi:hypothetical protein
MQQRRWDEMSPRQKTVILTLASIEIALTATALVDLARRPAEGVRGPKVAWAIGCFVQPVGPIAYLTLGRRRG